MRHRTAFSDLPAPIRPRRSRPKRRPQQFQASPQRRSRLIWLLLMVAACLLLTRLAYLQLLQGDTLHEMARQQQVRPALLPLARRPITDRQGNLLAVDRTLYTLYGHPMLFRQAPGVVAQSLAPVLDQPANQLSALLRQQDTGLRLAEGLTEDTARQIRRLRLDGLELIPQQQRFYPQQELFAQTVGFVDIEGNAKTGLEMTEQRRLTVPQSATLPDLDAVLPVSNLQTKTPDPLQLTLDSRLQRVAQEALRDTLEKYSAARGTVLVMDVNTGALRAMAVEPTFDPNRYFDADLEWLKNWVVSDFYEPGSTLKPINVAIALEAGAIAPDSTVYDAGQIQIDEWTIENSDYESSGRQGTLTITEVLQYSSNVGMVGIMNQMLASEFYEWLEKLELDQLTGIDLPAEATPPLKDREQFINSPVDVATASFGQGLVLTPLKLLQLHGAIANGGKLVTPHVLEGLLGENGDLTWQPQRPAPKVVFSPETSQTVLQMMEKTVSDGSGKAAQLPGYRIAGKTGTAQKVTEYGYYGDGRITSFVGILPVEAPRFVVLAVIDEPWGDNIYGSTVAAPLVKEVMDALVVFEGIPPSSPQALGGIWVRP
ncbi:MAG: penicillin-binding protein 2 [Cyanobacteria bacterium]|nr:penicillin-binding protein 2 [Cyanobacteriota bacterium]MDA0866398.1 penicillin-binding protein 2 [Cyanobacteriota bacterium]